MLPVVWHTACMIYACMLSGTLFVFLPFWLVCMEMSVQTTCVNSSSDEAVKATWPSRLRNPVSQHMMPRNLHSAWQRNHGLHAHPQSTDHRNSSLESLACFTESSSVFGWVSFHAAGAYVCSCACWHSLGGCKDPRPVVQTSRCGKRAEQFAHTGGNAQREASHCYPPPYNHDRAAILQALKRVRLCEQR